MLSNDNFYQDITSRTAIDTGFALSCQSLALTVVDTCRNRDCKPFLHRNKTASVTIGTLFFDNLTGTAAVRTCLNVADCSKERLLRKYNLTLAAALRTGFRAGSRLRARAVTGLTLFLHRQLDFFFRTEYSLFKGDSDAGAQVCSLHGTASCAGRTSASAKEISENIPENVSKICAVKIKTAEAASSAGATVKCRMSELIVLTSLFGITQNSICFGCFLKLLFCFFISRVHIRMIFLGKSTICLFESGVIGIFVNTEDFVIISFLFRHNSNSSIKAYLHITHICSICKNTAKHPSCIGCRYAFTHG